MPVRISLCRHCGQRRSNQARGLCKPCYLSPEVRALYPDRRADNEGRYVGLGAGNCRSRTPRRPSLAPPHSAQRIRVMQRRVARGESVKRDGDAGY